jgi:hypothetical protein
MGTVYAAASPGSCAHPDGAQGPCRLQPHSRPVAASHAPDGHRSALDGNAPDDALGALSFGLLGERGDWRTSVVEYTNMYTNETFSPLNPDGSLQAIELSALGAKVGANLTPENVALPGLRFTVAFMLSFGGSPLGVIAHVDPSGAPVVLCIIANHAPDAPIRSERRGDLSLAWWSRSGRGHLVIGRIPEERVDELAETLQTRI